MVLRALSTTLTHLLHSSHTETCASAFYWTLFLVLELNFTLGVMTDTFVVASNSSLAKPIY
jgi:hypothetical protein